MDPDPILLKSLSYFKESILDFLNIQKEKLTWEETMKRIRVMNEVIRVVTITLIKSGRKGRQVDYQENDLITKIAGIKELDGTSVGYIHSVAFYYLEDYGASWKGGLNDLDTIRRALVQFLGGYMNDFGARWKRVELAWKEFPDKGKEKKSSGKFTSEFSRIQTQSLPPGSSGNKKSEFFGFFGYPYGFYGYGGYGRYPGGYDNYPYDSYPYNWSHWWYNNGYGKKDGPGIKIIVINFHHERERRLETPGVVTQKEAELAAKWFAEAKINVYDFISGKDAANKFQTWRYALQEEATEHGSLGGAKTNVTNDDLLTTAKIAFAHFKERSDYYHRLYEFVNQRRSSESQPGIQTRLSEPQKMKEFFGMHGLPSRRQQQQQRMAPQNQNQSRCYFL